MQPVLLKKCCTSVGLSALSLPSLNTKTGLLYPSSSPLCQSAAAQLVLTGGSPSHLWREPRAACPVSPIVLRLVVVKLISY